MSADHSKEDKNLSSDREQSRNKRVNDVFDSNHITEESVSSQNSVKTYADGPKPDDYVLKQNSSTVLSKSGAIRMNSNEIIDNIAVQLRRK